MSAAERLVRDYDAVFWAQKRRCYRERPTDFVVMVDHTGQRVVAKVLVHSAHLKADDNGLNFIYN